MRWSRPSRRRSSSGTPQRNPYVPPEHTYRFASALAASQVPHAMHVFTHGPHGLGVAQDAAEAAAWTTLASAWIHEQASR
jgi:dipeptidyl aminopeptidase/acylaminoacyl peptidase